MNSFIRFFLSGILACLSYSSFSTAFSVTSVADNGAGTLRQAITSANADLTSTTGAPHTITFTGAGIGQINLVSSLPAVTNHISINGGTLGNVIINGGNTAAVSQGLLYNALNCSGSVLQNMVINNTGGPVGVGVFIQSPAISVTITNCRIGTNAAGTAAVPNQLGIKISGSADGGHTITNNLISGNIQVGLVIYNSINNTIRGNYVGLDVTGSNAMGNTGNGIDLNVSSGFNIVDKNVVGSNTGGGILLTTSSNNTITGNYVGIDATGLVARGNQWDGIGLLSGSNYNMIGGTTAAARNVCSGGASAISSGIAIKSDAGAASSYNIVLNNYCGIGSDGTTPLGNANYGIYLGYTNATNNIIGKPGFGNVVAYNLNAAIYLENAGTINNSIRGNSIFCNGPGTAPAAGQANVGIQLNAANNAIAAPTINAASTAANIFGSGLNPKDTVDLYYVDGCRTCTYPNGKTYIGTAIADATGTWSYTGGATSATNVTVTVTQYNASGLPGNTSPFSNCSVSLPMPVTLISFDAVYSNNAVDLLWATAYEKNNSYFLIERSSDGINFEAIGKVEGGGNSNHYLSYSFTDNTPVAGIVYYRLKQVDIDGVFVYSAIKSVTVSDGNNVFVYPTPVNTGNEIHVKISSLSEVESVTINVVDILGKEVLHYSGNGAFHTLSSAQLAKGVYLVIVQEANTTSTNKIVVN
ncbi:MAG TPA: T9SS type A sorting domain-containing protein [Cytophagaceae bacterium]|jgi:parallel beta-helix repeat protein|nr:T9SS type A sorting domain-containing protein [Cytophagaceae bacterium]